MTFRYYVAGLVEPAFVPDPQALAGATEDLESFFSVVDELRSASRAVFPRRRPSHD